MVVDPILIIYEPNCYLIASTRSDVADNVVATEPARPYLSTNETDDDLLGRGFADCRLRK